MQYFFGKKYIYKFRLFLVEKGNHFFHFIGMAAQ